jgi:hypothetical protein
MQWGAERVTRRTAADTAADERGDTQENNGAESSFYAIAKPVQTTKQHSAPMAVLRVPFCEYETGKIAHKCVVSHPSGASLEQSNQTSGHKTTWMYATE